MAHSHYLTKQQLALLEDTLREQQETLLRNARESLSSQVSAGEPIPADTIDVSTDESLQVTQLRLRDREKYLLNKIQKALMRFEDGSFGYCVECDGEIGFNRLKARPMAELCIDCKEEQEREEKLRSDKNQEDERTSTLFSS